MKINCKLFDPDGGVNESKKKARIGLRENISPKPPNEFSTEGYNDDLSDVPIHLKEKGSDWHINFIHCLYFFYFFFLRKYSLY